MMKLMLFFVRLIPPALLRGLVRWRFNSAQQQAPMAVARSLVCEPVLLLDVRTRDEFESGHLANATHVVDLQAARRLIDEFLAATPQGRIVTYCTVGYRSAQFAERLASIGCTEVLNLEGGIWAWIAAGQPTTKPKVEPS